MGEEGVVEEEGGEQVEEETVEEDPLPGGDGKTTTSADADTTLLFTKPVGTSNMELPAGQVTELLIGFTNKGDQEMMLDSLEASLRYPMDFSFHIQNFFIDPVFNETVQIVEFDEGFDTETFFMYVCIAGGLVLLLFLGFNLLSGKKTSRPQKVVETGTEGEDGVDYEWIPKSALRSTPASGKTSPRQRKNKAGSDSD